MTGERWTYWDLLEDVPGFGPLTPLLTHGRDGAAVCDVLVNGPGDVWVDRGSGLERADVDVGGPEDLRRLAQRIVGSAGRRLDGAQPWADASLAHEGMTVRVHALLPPLVADGACLSLRVRRPNHLTIERLVAVGSLEPDAAELLTAAIRCRRSLVLTGGTGSGKTTVLEALLAAVPHGERILVIEESAELAPRHPHVVSLVARPPNIEGAGAVSLRDLVRQSLRMRPDRIVLGEARGPEVVDLLSAFNTGHAGGAATLHASALDELPARFELLGVLAGLAPDVTLRLVAAALQIAVHLERSADGRRAVTEIGLISRTPSGLAVTPAWRIGCGLTGEASARLVALVSP